jgi:hypothetical protein
VTWHTARLRLASRMLVCIAVVLAALPASPASSQKLCPDGAVDPGTDCGVTIRGSGNLGGSLAGATLNAVLGGLTSGIFRRVAGEPFLPAFAKGAAGGTVTYAGRAIAGRQFDGAGLLGREVAAIGSSMVANAAYGRGMLEQVALPLGPLKLHVDRDDGTSFSMSVDVLAAIMTTYAVAHPEYSIDWRSTASAGVPVFRSPSLLESRSWSGAMVAGVIVLNYERDVPGVHRVQAHEQVHVAQHDFSAMVWGEPLERWLLGLVPYGDRVGRRVDVGLDFLFWAGLHSFTDRRSTPWEREARFLSRH